MNPTVPGPIANMPSANASELSVFDSLGGWDCALSRFPTMTSIPRAFRSKWAHIYDNILVHWERGVNNQDPESIDRALKAFLFLPQLLLRQGGRGGKRGQTGPGLAAKFDLAMEGEWETLVNLRKADLRRLEDRESCHRQEGNPNADNGKLREEIL